MDLAYKLFGKEEELSPTVVALLVCEVRDLLKVCSSYLSFIFYRFLTVVVCGFADDCSVFPSSVY